MIRLIHPIIYIARCASWLGWLCGESSDCCAAILGDDGDGNGDAVIIKGREAYLKGGDIIFLVNLPARSTLVTPQLPSDTSTPS